MGDPAPDFDGIVQGATRFVEGGIPFVFLPNLGLYPGCNPPIVDCLLALGPFQGYPTRLFFAQQVTRDGRAPNWNGQYHVLGRNWVAYSWGNVSSTLPAAQVLLAHLEALR